MCPEPKFRSVNAISLEDNHRPDSFRFYRTTLEDVRVEDVDSTVMDNVLSHFQTDSLYIWPTIALYIVGAAFSAIHLAAWNWEIPAPVARTLWRVFGVVSVSTTLFSIVLVIGFNRYNNIQYRQSISITIIRFSMLMWLSMEFHA